MTVNTKFQNEGRWEIEAEADLSAAAAVTATRGTNVSCTKTGTGTYRFTIKGNQAQKMYEVLDRSAKLNGTPATAFNARVTAVAQASDGSDDITVDVTTLTNAATPAAADTTGACVLGIRLVLRTVRMGMPL